MATPWMLVDRLDQWIPVVAASAHRFVIDLIVLGVGTTDQRRTVTGRCLGLAISAPHKNCKRVEEMHLAPATPDLVNRSHKPRHCTGDLGMEMPRICQGKPLGKAEMQIA